jgi:hypothetical protein
MLRMLELLQPGNVAQRVLLECAVGGAHRLLEFSKLGLRLSEELINRAGFCGNLLNRTPLELGDGFLVALMQRSNFLAVSFLQFLHDAMMIGTEAVDEGFSPHLRTAVSPRKLLRELRILCGYPMHLIFRCNDFRLDRGQIVRKALEFIVSEVDLLVHAVSKLFHLPLKEGIHRHFPAV